MPYTYFTCPSCGLSEQFRYRSCDWARVAECEACGFRLTREHVAWDRVNRDAPNSNFARSGRFKRFFSFTADRWFDTQGEWRAHERELERKGCYVKGERAQDQSPSARQSRKMIAEHGKAYLKAVGRDAAIGKPD